MATYYIRKTGSNTAPYDTPAKAALTFAAVRTYIIANGGSGADVVDIGPGVYDDYIRLDNAALNGLYVGGPDDAIFNKIVTASAIANAEIDSLAFSPAAGQAITANGHTGLLLIKNSKVTEPLVPTDHCFRLYSGNVKILATDFIFSGAIGSSNYGVYVSGAGNLEMDHCLVRPRGDNHLAKSIVIGGSSAITADIKNTTVVGVWRSAIECINANATTVVSDSFISGGFGESTSPSCVRRTTGSVTVRNCDLVAGPFNDDVSFLSEGITEENNRKLCRNPKFEKSRGGFIAPMIDDTGGITDGYCAGLSALLASKGCYGTWVTNTSNMAEQYHQSARDILAAGRLEVGLHGRVHHGLALEYALNFSQSGGTSPTVAFDGRYITCSCAEPEFSQTIDTQDSTANTTANIIANYSGHAGWTIAKSTTDGQDAYRHANEVRPISYAVLEETAAPCDILFDRSGIEQGVFKDIVVDGITELSAIIGTATDPQTGQAWRCRTFGATYNAGDLVVKEAIRAAGLDVYRYNKAATVQESVSPLTAFDFFAYHPMSYSALTSDGATEAAVKLRARAIASAISLCGLATSVFAHNAEEFSIEQWGWFLDVFVREFPEVKVWSCQMILDHVSTSEDWTHAGSGVYTRSFTDDDYTPRSGSMLVGGGVNRYVDGVGDKYDITGVKVWDDTTNAVSGPWVNGPTVGAYAVAAPFKVGPWSPCDASLPTDGQICKSHALPIAAKKVTVFPGVASAAQINEAKG